MRDLFTSQYQDVYVVGADFHRLQTRVGEYKFDRISTLDFRLETRQGVAWGGIDDWWGFTEASDYDALFRGHLRGDLLPLLRMKQKIDVARRTGHSQSSVYDGALERELGKLKILHFRNKFRPTIWDRLLVEGL